MLGDGHEASGTIQDAAAETGFDGMFHIINFHRNLLIFGSSLESNSYLHVQAGPLIPNPQRLSDAARVALFTHYNSLQPHSVHYALEANPHPGSLQLNDFALYYQFALLDGRRITPLARSTRDSAGSSLVKVNYRHESFYGEVINIFSHTQPEIANGTRLLAELRWMIELPLVPVEDDPWSEL